MKRADALQRLSAHREELRQQFGVASLALFGPTVRNEATKESDSSNAIRAIAWQPVQ